MRSNQPDMIEALPCGSLIQHGRSNDRIYLMKPPESLPDDLPEKLIAKARELGYSKIFAKIPDAAAERFLQAGYTAEAVIHGFFRRAADCFFMGYFLDKKREIEKNQPDLERILDQANEKADTPLPVLKPEFSIRICKDADIRKMVKIFQKVFDSYPFPVYDPNYLLETMHNHVIYFGVFIGDKLVALSSSEIDATSATAEMTDFATLPEWRGHSFASHLLTAMEQSLRQHGIQTAYTIARAISPGMNTAFARMGYKLAGQLKNNTNISGGIESMNVWYKPMSPIPK